MTSLSTVPEKRNQLQALYSRVRKQTESLCKSLEIEDLVIQSMPDVSPTRWHLAHTSWFFETFLLLPELGNYTPLNSSYTMLFNSYYNAVGEQFPRSKRGILSRPTVKEVYQYRQYVDDHFLELLEHLDGQRLVELIPLIELGLNHEQQHQELMLTDIKHVFSQNPLMPAYSAWNTPSNSTGTEMQWLNFSGGIQKIGYQGSGFSFDNEAPRHDVLTGDFQLANRPVTTGEYQEFIDAGGYDNPGLWLSDGWATIQTEKWRAPLYWLTGELAGQIFTLAGARPLNPNEPVCHLSYYEADAFATWAGARLPSEAEWEIAAADLDTSGHFADTHRLHPEATRAAEPAELQQMFGTVWEWTASPYSAYPGYAPAAGAVGEYNGKFMSNQMVLRGGSCATPAGHIRKTYRNFFYPHCRWQFMGLRLARNS